MKTKELMIGDWVKNCFGKNERVEQILESSVMLAYNDTYSFDEIEPIPLTAEILEKNGLKLKRNDIFGWYEYRNGDDVFSLEYTGDSKHYDGYWSFSAVNKDCDVCMIVMHYVHELQHALRLIKIDKEIEL